MDSLIFLDLCCTGRKLKLNNMRRIEMETNPDLILLLMASGLSLTLLAGFLATKYMKSQS